MRRKAKAAGIRSGNEKVFRSGGHAGSIQCEAEVVATRGPSIRLPDYSIAGRCEKLELRIALSLYKTVLDIQRPQGPESLPLRQGLRAGPSTGLRAGTRNTALLS